MAKAQTKKAAPAAADEIVVGSQVKFLGYDESVPEEERILEAEQVYEVVGLPEVVKDEESGEDVETGFVVKAPNPDFNPKKKVHPDTNPEFLETEVLEDEIELVPGEPAAAAEPAAEAEAEAAKPARGKGKAGVKEQTAAADTKATKTAAKKTAKAAPKEEADGEEAANDELPDLENEDESVLALIAESDDLIATAQELEANVATTEFQLGGILFHIKKAKSYLEVEGGEAYDEAGGFQKFLLDFFNVDYRKAMYLIDIYTCFTLAGIENPSQVVAEIGWTKASKIAKHLVGENADVEGLIALAQENTVADLSEAIKEQVEVGSSKNPGEKKTRLTLKFRYFEEEAAIVEDTLNAAKEQLGLKDTTEALLHILQEWAITNGGEAAETGKEEQAAPARKAPGKPATKAASKRATAKA